MKQKILWIDLAICSIWTLAVLGCRGWWSLPAHLLILLTVISRITVAFVLNIGDKRGWVTLSIFMVLTSLILATGHEFVISYLCHYPFFMFGIKFDRIAYIIMCDMLAVWLWIIPFVIYIINLCRKRLINTKSSYQDLTGAILWHDHRARTYSLLMLVATLSLYAGLAMDARVCQLVCITAPTLSLWLLFKYYHVDTSQLWMMIVAMGIFYYAQSYYGLARVSMLGISLAVVAYICSRFYREKGLLAIAALTTVYIGILLPSLSVGNNQYTCINYSRKGFYTFEPLRGVLFINNVTGEKIGLRDRYGLLVEPQYEHICWHGRAWLFGVAELRKNGYVTYYRIYDNSFYNGGDICHELQDNICSIIENHFSGQSYDNNEHIEVKVKEIQTDKLVSHVKTTWNNGVYYDYKTTPYISEDTIPMTSGNFVCDSLVQVGGFQREVLHYSFDVTRDSMPIYNISIKTARNKMSEREELIELKDKIVEILKTTNNL